MRVVSHSRVLGRVSLVVGLALGLLACAGRPPAPETQPSADWRLSPDASLAERAFWDWFHGHGDALARTWLSPTPRRIETGPASGPETTPARTAAVDPLDPLDPLAPTQLDLGRLLMARLAEEALEPATMLRAAALAFRTLPPSTPAAHLAWRLSERAALDVSDGESVRRQLLGPQVPVPVAPAATRYTLRISFLPYLDARRLIASPPVLTGPDTLSALNKLWALSETAPKADTDGLVVSVHTLPPGPAHLSIREPGRLLAFRDGRLVLATPPDRSSPGTVRFTAEGSGPLILVWAASRVPAVELWPATFSPPRPGPATRPVDAILSALLALEDDDREGVERWLRGAPQTPMAALLRAEAAATDASLPPGRVRDARRAAWLGVLPAMPTRARLALARLARQGGDLDAAHQWLAPLSAAQGHAIHREAFHVHFALGWNTEAEADLDRAERSAARPCDGLDDRIALQGAQGNPTGRLRMVEPLVACGRGREAAELLLDLDRPHEALARLDALGGGLPAPAARPGVMPPTAARPAAVEDRKTMQARYRVLVALGRLDEARALAQRQAESPDEPGAALQALDLGPASALAEAMSAFTRRFPTARESRELLLAEPHRHFFAPLLLDTDTAIAAYEADAVAHPETYDGPAVRVLDHGATVYFPNGRRLRWVHEILAIRTREAAENFGEVNLPEGAEAVAVFTRKADGRRLYADDLPEKESLSVPDLAIGDYIVALYLEPGDNGYLYDSGYLTPRVVLRSATLPAFRQRLEIFGLDDALPEVQRLADAPEPAPIRLETLSRNGLRLDIERTPTLPPEPDGVPQPLYLPAVRFGRNVQLAEDLDFTRDRILGRRQQNAEFEAWALTQSGDGPTERRAARLARAVRDRVDGETGLIADDAPRMWETGHGHRALVLSAALEAAGIPHRLLLARPRVHVPSDPFTQIADFPYALIALGTPWEPTFGAVIDPGPNRAAVGFVPFGFLGGDAITVWPPDAAPQPAPLPLTRLVEDAREVHLRLHWAADGTLTGEVEDTLRGQEAIVIGDYLARLDPAARPKVAERLLVPVLGAATVTRFDDPTLAFSSPDPDRGATETAPDSGAEPADDGALRLRYAFTAKAGQTLELGLFPVSPGRAWGGRASRRTPLLIELPTHQRVTIELEGPAGLETQAARSVEIAHGPFHFERRVSPVSDGVWKIESRLDLEGGMILPADYGKFASTAAEIDPRESVGFRRVDSSGANPD